MSDHIIIVGGGRVGRHAAAELNPSRHTISVIERDAEQCKNFPQHLASDVIEGDGTDLDVFEAANPALADAVLGVTNDTATNLAVCELTKELSEGTRTMARIAYDGEQDYAHLGHVDNIIYPPAVAAEVAVDRITADVTSARRP
jgi:trk system potassium uptake protein TrkA